MSMVDNEVMMVAGWPALVSEVEIMVEEDIVMMVLVDDSNY